MTFPSTDRGSFVRRRHGLRSVRAVIKIELLLACNTSANHKHLPPQLSPPAGSLGSPSPALARHPCLRVLENIRETEPLSPSACLLLLQAPGSWTTRAKERRPVLGLAATLTLSGRCASRHAHAPSRTSSTVAKAQERCPEQARGHKGWCSCSLAGISGYWVPAIVQISMTMRSLWGRCRLLGDLLAKYFQWKGRNARPVREVQCPVARMFPNNSEVAYLDGAVGSAAFNANNCGTVQDCGRGRCGLESICAHWGRRVVG